MRAIKLSNGMQAYCDDADYPALSKFTWSGKEVSKNSGYFYAVRTTRKSEAGPKRMVYMHRQLLGLSKGDGRQVDHKDHFTLNNCRNNIRACSPAQNLQNQKLRSDSSSGYKGVSWDKTVKKWGARIMAAGLRLNLGYYDNINNAVAAYDSAAENLFGQFALTNAMMNRGQA